MTVPARSSVGPDARVLIRIAAIGLLVLLPWSLLGSVSEAWARSQFLAIPEDTMLQPVTGQVQRLDGHASDLGDGLCLTLANRTGQVLLAHAPGDGSALREALPVGRSVTIWLAPDSRPGVCRRREPLAWKVDMAGDTLVAYEAQRTLARQANDQRESVLFFPSTFLSMLLTAPLPVVALLALVLVVVGVVWLLLLLLVGVVWLLLPVLIGMMWLLRWLRVGASWVLRPLAIGVSWLLRAIMIGIRRLLRRTLVLFLRLSYAIVAIIQRYFQLLVIGFAWFARHLLVGMVWVMHPFLVGAEGLIIHLISLTVRIASMIGSLYGFPLRMIGRANMRVLSADQRCLRPQARPWPAHEERPDDNHQNATIRPVLSRSGRGRDEVP